MFTFEISSNVSARKIALSERKENHFFVELSGPGPNVSTKVSSYMNPHGLLKWLESLAAKNGPWSGENDWSTLEGEFGISAS
jgi:hypothetical protein